MARPKGVNGPGQFKPGQSGNPEGKAAIRPFLAALDRAIAQDSGKRLRECAEILLTLAAKGEPWAVQMLADRLDGKAAQPITLTPAVRDMSLDEILSELAAMESAKAGTADSGEAHKVSAAEPGIVH